MKKCKKINGGFGRFIAVILTLVLSTALSAALVACNKDNGDALRFAVPQGTPALAIARLVTDNKSIAGRDIDYAVVSSMLIGAEMGGDDKADLVVMPVNAGAVKITAGADYKMVGVAVDGSLFLVGKSDAAKTLTMDDIKGKKIACIGKDGTPGLVFRYVLAGNGLSVIDSGTPTADQVYVEYVADATAAKQRLIDDKVDFAVVGEPAATAFKGAISCKAEMDIQSEYKNITGKDTYPQAGLFVRTSLANDSAFMSALFQALAASRQWVTSNPGDVTEFAKANLYDGAAFPAASIPRCAIDASALNADKQARVIEFLKAVVPNKDWDNASIFG